MELLKTDGVSKVFGGLKAVSNFDIEINEGELIGLIGPNGAGKTTAFNLLTGVYQPTTGTIDFAGKSLVGLKPYQITSRGIARTFQNIRLFSELTVLDNIAMEAPKTKAMIKVLENLEANRKTLIVMDEVDENVALSARNIPGVKVINSKGLNVYDILDSTKLVMTEGAIKAVEEVLA